MSVLAGKLGVAMKKQEQLASRGQLDNSETKRISHTAHSNRSKVTVSKSKGADLMINADLP